MTRKKVKLAYISNDAARKSTFRKRKKGLMKKARELTTLCGIDACLVIYSPYDAQPEIWPSLVGVQRVLSQFKSMPQLDQSKKMMNQDGFLRQQIGKALDQMKKQRKENREMEVSRVMSQSLTGMSLDNLNMMDLNDLGWIIDRNLKNIYKRYEDVGRVMNPERVDVTGPTLLPLAPPQPQPQPQPPLPSLPPVPVAPMFGGPILEVAPPLQGMDGQDFAMNVDAMQRQPWTTDFINPSENFGFVGDDVMMPLMDNNYNSPWPNPFFP